MHIQIVLHTACANSAYSELQKVNGHVIDI